MTYSSKRRKIICLILIAITLSFIFGNSMLGSDTSSQISSGFLKFIYPTFKMIFSEKLATEYLLRKIAHFSEFALLSLEFCFLFMEKGKEKRFMVLFFGLFSAVTDETIQIFSGRVSSTIDVFIDFTGVMFSLVVFETTLRLIKKEGNFHV